MTDAYKLFNADARFPLCISVPHAGRNYPASIDQALAVSLPRTRPLEDRYADALIGEATASGYAAIVAQVPRLLIDLNRAETDFDPTCVDGVGMQRGSPSVRARGGLGLVPHRLADVGNLWKKPLSTTELARRIATQHRPYHTRLAQMLARAEAIHGVAVLLDVHSMPSLAGPRAADMVIGDLHGYAADSRLVEAAHDFLTQCGLRVAINAPYAGGHILARHARPDAGIHGLQIEIDRRLYLDSMLDLPAEGTHRIARVVAELAAVLSQTALAFRQWPIAAE